MKNAEIEAVLSQAKGRHFMFKEQRQKLIRFEIKDTIIRIVTDVQDISILHTDFESTFQQFEILSANDVMVQSMEKTLISGSARELKDVLLENIRKVKENKEYIPQAQAIKENVDSIISLAKAEVETMKAVRQLYGGGQ